MAGDWIKMRVLLPSDPKVIQMASVLAEDRSFCDWLTDPVRCTVKETAWEHVDHRVIVCVTVTALLTVWGVCQERGKRDGEDMILDGVTLDVLDDVALIPGIGAAMESVGWVVQDGDNLRFPNYLDDNTISRERIKEQARLRQKRHRDKARDSHGNESVTTHKKVTLEQSRADQSTEQAVLEEIAQGKESAILSGDACSVLRRVGLKEHAIDYLMKQPGVDDCAVNWAVRRLIVEQQAHRNGKRDKIKNAAGYVRDLLTTKGGPPQSFRDEYAKQRLSESAAKLNGVHP